MQYLIIAGCSDAITEALTEAIKSKYLILACKNRDELDLLLDGLHSYILIIDLFLYETEAIRIIGKHNQRPNVVLALTYTISQAIIDRAHSVGVHQLLLLPCTMEYILDQLALLTQGHNI